MDSISPNCLSDYRIDKHLLGVESPEERAQTLEHIQICPSCAQKYRQFKETKESFVGLPQDYRTIRQTLEEPPSFSLPSWLFVPLTLAGALLLLWLQPWQQQQTKNQHLTIKGKKPPTIFVALKRNQAIQLVSSGFGFKKEDKLRLAVMWKTTQPYFLFVLHQGVRQDWSPMYPDSKEKESLRIAPNQRVELPESLTVSGKNEGSETIWFCFSKRQLPFTQAVDALRSFKLQQKSEKNRDCKHIKRFVINRVDP